MAYLSSDNVKVFPTTYRGSTGGNRYDPEARLNSERNLTTSLNALADYSNGSFVLSAADGVIKFIIHGYYFEITHTTSGNLWARIKLVDRGNAGATDWACTSLASLGSTATDTLDDTNGFTGLAITDTEPTLGTNEYKLQLLESGAIPTASKLKISSDSVGNSYKIETTTETTTYNMPISQLFRSNAIVVNKGTETGQTGLTIGYDMQSPTSPAKFTVDGYTGNTTIEGTLGVTGATALTSATLSSTLAVTGAATFNGAATFSNGATISSLTVNGNIACGSIDADAEVKCDSLAVGQIGGTSDITLCKTLLPQNNNLSLGSGGNLFNSIYSKQLYLINGANSIDISCSNSTWSIAVDGACNFLTSGILTIGRSSGAQATFETSDVTFNKTIKSSATGNNLAIDVTGSNTGKIKCKELEATTQINATKIIGNTQSGSSAGDDAKIYYGVGSGSSSVTVVGNAIYVFTITNDSNSYSATMMFTNNAASDMHLHLYLEGSRNMILQATKNSGTGTWTVKLYAEGTEQTSASIEYAQIAKLA